MPRGPSVAEERDERDLRRATAGRPAAGHAEPALRRLPAAGTERSVGSLLYLQQAAGNRAAVAAAGGSAVSGAADPGTLQRKNGGRKSKKRRNRGRGGGQQTSKQPPPQVVTPPQPQPVVQQGLWGTLGSYASSLGNALWGGTTTGTEGEGDLSGGEINEGGLGHTTQGRLSGDVEPEEAPKDLLSTLMDIPRVAIKLEKELPGGGKASGSGSVSREGAAGKAKVEWNGAFHQSESNPVKLFHDSLTGKGTFMAGIKAGGELEGKLGMDEKGGLALGSKGKLAAFAGIEMKGETEVVLEVGGHQTKMKGALGMTMGVGGELSYWLSFEGGKLSWGTKGKAALGIGVSWEYQLELPVASVTTSMWSWLTAGVSGLSTGLSTAADYLEYYGFLSG